MTQATRQRSNSYDAFIDKLAENIYYRATLSFLTSTDTSYADLQKRHVLAWEQLLEEVKEPYRSEARIDAVNLLARLERESYRRI